MPPEGLGELALAALRVSPDGLAVYLAERACGGEVTRFVVELVNEAFARWAGGLWTTARVWTCSRSIPGRLTAVAGR